MEMLRFFSMLYSQCFAMVIFLMLYDLRFDRKKNNLISALAISALILLTTVLFFILGREIMTKLIYVTLTIPSMIFFFFMAKKPDGRFFFSFCVADTIRFELVILTMLLDRWFGDDKAILLFVLRLILFPLLSAIIWKYVRKPFKESQNSVRKGWGLFAMVSCLYYVLLAYMVSFPRSIIERPDDVPTLLFIFAIMPLTYIAFFRAMRSQKELYEAQERHLNTEMQRQILLVELAAEREHVAHAKQHRHDMRHVVAVTRDYLSKEKYAAADAYLSEFDSSITSRTLTVYCENQIMNALFHITDKYCQETGIACTISAQIPEKLPLTDMEISMLFGNLLENACEAAGKCEDPFVHITMQVKNENLLMEIRNRVSGEVVFKDGLPLTTKEDGGIGVKSARKVLEKHGGMLKMQQEGDVFITRILQGLAQ